MKDRIEEMHINYNVLSNYVKSKSNNAKGLGESMSGFL